MAYTTPYTFVALQVLTAAQLNAIQANIAALWPYTAAGDIPYTTAANTLAALAKGTAGQGLKMNSGATAPEWVDDIGVGVGTRVRRTSAQSIPNSSITTISFAEEIFDTASMFDAGSPTILTTQVSGIYLVGGLAYFDPNSTGTRELYIYKNESYISVRWFNPAVLSFNVNFAELINITAGDTLSLRVNQSSGGALNAYCLGFWAVLLGGT